MSKKIFFVAAHRLNRSPSQRYRFEQYLPFLLKNGYQYKLANLISANDDRLFYSNGNWILKALLILKFFLKRYWHVVESLRYDIIFIQREAFFIGPPFFEYLFKWTGKKIIFDFDDAIWMPNVSDGNRQLVALKFPQKISTIMKLADRLIAGNVYLKEYAEQFNEGIFVIPSTIDLNYYKINWTSSKQSVCIGWSGSSTTIQHFKTIESVLKKLKNKYADKINFVVYGDENFVNNELEIKGKKWSSNSEVEVLNQFDIGIMPLPDNEWTKGKCAMKALQYMALAKPVVISPVGVNKDIINENENGFLATTEEEWFLKLDKLVGDELLRKKIGEAGRQTIINGFSVEANCNKYLAALNF